jgi:CheY-like chemotaxis protein
VSNALTVALGWLEGAREHVAASHPGRRAIDIAWSRAKLARKLARRAIGDETDAGEQEAELESVVLDAVTGLEPMAARRGVRLAVVGGHVGVARFVQSGSSLLQVLTNLLLNAVSMSPNGGTVEVRLEATASEARLIVADEGPGIPAELRRTVFEGGVSLRRGGAGIGLRHAHELATASGAGLSLADSARGTEFAITWPLVALASPPEPPASSLPNTSLAGVRVLLLEDDEAVIGLLTTALALRGAQVTAARSSGELAAAVKSTSYDAALLDLSPIASDIGGALAKLREQSPRTRLVLISGSSAEVPASAASLMSAWIRKPFEVGELLAVLRSLPPESG